MQRKITILHVFFCLFTKPQSGRNRIWKPHLRSNWSWKLNVPLSGSCRFQGTYLKKQTNKKRTNSLYLLHNSVAQWPAMLWYLVCCYFILTFHKVDSIWSVFDLLQQKNSENPVMWVIVKLQRVPTLWEYSGHRPSSSAAGPPSRLWGHGSNELSLPGCERVFSPEWTEMSWPSDLPRGSFFSLQGDS